MLIKASLLSLSLVAFSGHTPWPIGQGHHLQTTQRQTDDVKSVGISHRGRSAPSEVDALYEAIMRAAAPGASKR
ncbi:MAG TPA: hypothetical protein VHU15_02165 [Stellaceae bacterium]|jgi:hypothetical protein|nr:hypothetical protein [Stellaceae bacterium]